MKKAKQIAAICSLICIGLLIIGFIVAAFTTTATSKNVFYAFFFGIIALPILAWIIIFCIGRMQGKHTMAELFPEATIDSESSNQDSSHTEQSK